MDPPGEGGADEGGEVGQGSGGDAGDGAVVQQEALFGFGTDAGDFAEGGADLGFAA